jgi:hypothetical protein
MDARTRRVVQALDAYLQAPPPGTPQKLLGELENAANMLDAPRLTEESPGEKSAREIAEQKAQEQSQLNDEAKDHSPEQLLAQ